MTEDKFDIEIDEDGNIKVTTDYVSQTNHRNAEDFMAFLARAAGGTISRVKRPQAHSHAHVARTVKQGGK